MSLTYVETKKEFNKLIDKLKAIKNAKNKFNYDSMQSDGNVHLLNLYFLNESGEPRWMTISIHSNDDRYSYFEMDLSDTNIDEIKSEKSGNITEVWRFIDKELDSSTGPTDFWDYMKQTKE